MDEFDFVDEQTDVRRGGGLSQNKTTKRSSRRKRSRRLGGFTSRLGRGRGIRNGADTTGNADVEEISREPSPSQSSSSSSSSSSASPTSSQHSPVSSSSPAQSSLLSCTTSSLATQDTSNAVVVSSPNENDRISTSRSRSASRSRSVSVLSKSERSLRSPPTPPTPSTPPTPPSPPSPGSPPRNGSKIAADVDVNMDMDEEDMEELEDFEHSQSQSQSSENGQTISKNKQRRQQPNVTENTTTTTTTTTRRRRRQASSSSSSSSSFTSMKSTMTSTSSKSSSIRTASRTRTTKKRQRQFSANGYKYKEQKHVFDTGRNENEDDNYEEDYLDEDDEGDDDDKNNENEEENDEDGSSYNYNEDNHSHNLLPHAYAQDPGDVQVTGAGTDVFAVQDAGSFRLVQDDCAYLCSSFLSSIGADRVDRDREGASSNYENDNTYYDQNSNGNGHGNGNNKNNSNSNSNSNSGSSRSELMKNIRQSSSITAGAACDLALMLSCKKTRDDLVNLGSGVENEFSQESFLSDATEDNDAVQGVLDVLSFVPPSIMGSRLPTSFLHMDIDEDMGRKTYSAKANTGGDGCIRGYDGIVAEALSLLANFFSFDCTQNTKYSASPSPSAASSFRKTMLRHSGAMRAIARLSLADPLVMRILGKNSEEGNEITEGGEPNCDSQENDILDEAETTQRKKKKRRIRYSTDEDDNKKKPVGDPTKVGRRNKNRRLKKCNDKSVSKPLSSSSPNLTIYRTKLERAYKIQNETQIGTELDNTTQEYGQSPGFLALNAFKRIITGKFDDEDQNELCDGEDGDDSSQHNDSDIECDDLEKQNLKNPLIFRNIMIRRSGALPFLSRAMAESLEAAVMVFNDVNTFSSDKSGREKILNYLSERIQCLSSVLDTLCCLSAENRRILCGVGQDIESFDIGNHHDPILIPSLLRAITAISVAPSVDNATALPEIVLASFRTLTSMTHENELAGVQLMKKYIVPSDESKKPEDSVYGVEVLITVLHSLITLQQDIRDGTRAEPETHQKNVYDAIVFTLNTLTNVLETPSANDARRAVLDHKMSSNGSNKISSTLAWLASWVVSQTSTFQDAVIIDGCFGDSSKDSNDNSQQRDLQHHEDEFLVQAGNGFILLACFLLGADSSHAEPDLSLDHKIREEIMSEMPNNDGGSKGMSLIINTLKAFCNFYRYSIGELSVAVIDPVLKLISKLEKIQ